MAANPALARANRSNSPSTAPISRSGTSRRSFPTSPTEPQIQAPERLFFVIPGPPCPKPRQTKSDKWKKRPSVLRYRAWADSARKAARKAAGQRFPGPVLYSYGRMKVVAYFPIPRSWTKAVQERMKGKPHRQIPDSDNLMKAASDALFPTRDSQLYEMVVRKFWDDGEGSRVEITLS